MAVPKYNEFFGPLLQCLADGATHTNKEIREFCADSYALSAEDRNAKLESGQNLLRNRVGWAKTHLKMAGLIDCSERAKCTITQLGLDVLKKGTDILTLEYIHELQLKNGGALPDPPETVQSQKTQSPQEAIEFAMDQLKSELADELLGEVTRMDEYDFEQLVVDLLLKMGYGKPEENQDAVTKKSGDGGIDGIVRTDRFGFDAIYTQAKRWKADSHVQSPDIQKFLGAMVAQGATKGLFITTAQFTKGAAEMAAKNPGHKIVLIDGKQLAQLMIEFGLGVTTVKTYEVKRIDSDYFNMDE